MSRIVTKVTLTLPLAALCLGAFAAPTAPVVPGVRGQASKRFAAPPLIVTVKTMSAEIVQGEPLTVKYEIANAADGAIAASKRIRGADWLDVRLVRADNSEIQALPPLRFDNPKRSQTKFIVFGGSPYEGYRVAGRWSEAVAPGSYQVWVRARLPYDTTDGPEKADGDKMERAPDAVAVAQFRFPLTVLPLNAARLTLSAENLKQGISQGQGAYPTETLIEQLFALPATIARPVWLDLMQTPHIEPTTRGDILCALILRRDIEAANLLARAGWRADPRLDTEDGRRWRGSCLATLRILYRGAGDPMKKRIESLFLHYTGKPPAQDEIVIGYP